MTVTITVTVVVLGVAWLRLVSAGPPPPTPPRSLDAILNNTRSRENYIRCFMDRGICNKDAISIKKILTEALIANCSNCTQAQRAGATRFFEYLQDHQPDTWERLRDKYGRGMGREDDSEDSDDDDDDDDDGPPSGAGVGPQNVSTTASTANVTTSTISIIF